MYAEGKGVPQNHKTAVKWYRRAANQEYAKAQQNLGAMYTNGLGVSRDLAEAARWIRLAAEQGLDYGQYGLGFIYEFGRGVPQDDTEAAKWYGRAAKQGLDHIKAIKWYREVADDGDAEAQYGLGKWYEIGRGVPQDIAEAVRRYRLAADQGDPDAKKALEILEPKTAINTFPTKPIDVHFRSSLTRPNDIAVIIGNADYGKQGKDIPNVIPAYADAEGIKLYVKQALGIRDENIIFLKDASQAVMISTFGSATNPKGQLFNYVKAGKSRVFVYYSGHGAPGSEEGGSYIVPADAQASLIELNGYPLKTLYKNLSKIPAKSVMLVLEACFSGSSQSGTLISKASPIQIQPKETNIPPNITVISAGAANQIASWEQDSSSGLFTKYFLKGMSGEADAKPYGNGDGKVGYDELDRYFKETLTYYARRYYGRDQTAQIVVGSGG